jgi:hypothetical protein
MKIDDVKARAFAMPLTSPAFPPGPYRFIDREYLIITYRTDPAALEAVIPASASKPPAGTTPGKPPLMSNQTEPTRSSTGRAPSFDAEVAADREGALCGSASLIGSSMVNRQPFPSVLSVVMSPPCRSITILTR